jgi:hypothetical protein
MNFEQLEKKVQRFNDLPDQEKIGDNNKKIKAAVNDYKKQLLVLESQLDCPNSISDQKRYTDREFIETIAKLNQLKTDIDNETDLNKSVALYLELHRLANGCKFHLESKSMDTVYLDKDDSEDDESEEETKPKKVSKKSAKSKTKN